MYVLNGMVKGDPDDICLELMVRLVMTSHGELFHETVEPHTTNARKKKPRSIYHVKGVILT